MEIDFAKLSPVMAKENFINNYQGAILKLQKNSIEQTGDMLTQLLDSAAAPASGVGESVDIQL